MLTIEEIEGSQEAVEGEGLEFRISLRRTDNTRVCSRDLRVDVEASYSHDYDQATLPQRVVYLSSSDMEEIIYRFRPNLEMLPSHERLKGVVQITFAVTAIYREGDNIIRKSKAHKISVKLNSERIIRRVGNLGNILGLKPKGMM